MTSIALGRVVVMAASSVVCMQGSARRRPPVTRVAVVTGAGRLWEDRP
jgi:hypothetical protein